MIMHMARVLLRLLELQELVLELRALEVLHKNLQHKKNMRVCRLTTFSFCASASASVAAAAAAQQEPVLEARALLQRHEQEQTLLLYLGNFLSAGVRNVAASLEVWNRDRLMACSFRGNSLSHKGEIISTLCHARAPLARHTTSTDRFLARLGAYVVFEQARGYTRERAASERDGWTSG